MTRSVHRVLAAATAVFLAAAVAAGARAGDMSKLDGTIVGTIGHGPHKHKVIAPASSEEKPGRAHTPLRLVVPAIEPRAHWAANLIDPSGAQDRTPLAYGADFEIGVNEINK